MIVRTSQIDLLTDSYRIVGDLNVTSGGVLGVLCDPNSSFLEINHANLARIHVASKLSEQAPLIRVVKQHVSVVCLSRREDVGPYANPHSGYAHLQRQLLRITTPTFELEGTLEWAGRFDFVALMAEGASDFVPLYDVSLGAILFPALLIQAPAMLFNRRHLYTLAQMGEGTYLK